MRRLSVFALTVVGCFRADDALMVSTDGSGTDSSGVSSVGPTSGSESGADSGHTSTTDVTTTGSAEASSTTGPETDSGTSLDATGTTTLALDSGTTGASADGGTATSDGTEGTSGLTGATTTTGTTTTSASTSSTTIAPTTGTTSTGPECGNGVEEPPEECDDDNNIDGDGCEADCTLPACDNGIVDPGELCLVQSLGLADGVNVDQLEALSIVGTPRADIALAGDTELDVFLGRADRSFQAKVPLSLATTAGSTRFELADLDGDTRLDLVYVDLNANKMFTGGGAGDGSFSDIGESTPATMGAGYFALGDFQDSDPAPDVVTWSADLRYGTSDGLPMIAMDPWTNWFDWEMESGTLGSHRETIARDFNGDNKADFAVAYTTLSMWTVNVTFGDGALGSVDGRGESTPDNKEPTRIRAADLDDDLDEEIVFLSVGQYTIIPGGDSSVPTETKLAGADSTDFVLADLDNDGFEDIVQCTFSNDELWFLRGDGAMGFDDGIRILATECEHLAVGDFDGDGANDLVVSLPNSTGVRVFHTQP